MLVTAIRRHGSLAATAKALQVTPSSVTKRLAALEAELGLRLFQRTTRRVSPTTEGDALCERANRLLAAFDELEAELRERQTDPAGPIRLAATFGFGRLWVGPALADFRHRYPRVTVDLQLTERLPDLAVEGFDGAIWLWKAPGERDSEWISRRLASNQRVLVAAPAYLRSHGAPRTPEDLSQHDCLVVRENSGGNDRHFDHWRLHRGKEPQVLHMPARGSMSSNSGELVRDWCLAGQGIMLRSLWDIGPNLADGSLVRVLPDYAMPDADIHWLAPYKPQTPKRIRLLVDFLAQRFREQPWKLKTPSAAAPPDSRRKP